MMMRYRFSTEHFNMRQSGEERAMRVKSMAAVACGFVLALTGAARADDAKAREIIDKAITAHGGEAEMKKLDCTSMKMKGTIHVMGMEIAFTGDAASKGADQPHRPRNRSDEPEDPRHQRL
jgi:hypothetical protein